jgi:hypothetical protein
MLVLPLIEGVLILVGLLMFEKLYGPAKFTNPSLFGEVFPELKIPLC